MSKMRKGVMVASTVAVVSVAAACGGGSGGGGGETSLRFANVYEGSHPFNECGFQTVSEEAESQSNGSITMENFPGGQIGAEDELAESVTGGNLEMAIIGPSFLAAYDERLGVLDAAYLFDDVEHMEQVTDGEIGRELWDGLLEESNMRVLGTWYYGTRQLTTNGTEATTPEDLGGLEVRAPDAPVPVANVRAMGGSPTPVALNEVYTALDQGTVNGQENPISTIAAENFNEVQDYLMLSDHVVQSTQIVVSDQEWQTLSEEQQNALQGAVDNATPEVRDCIEQEEEEYLSEWRDSESPQIVEDVDKEAFSQRAEEQLTDEFGEEWGDTYQRIQEAGD